MNWADEDHFEQCLAFVPLVPRATHLATAKELATRWNSGVDELDRDLLGVQLARIVDASFHSVNLVPCPAPVTVGDLPPGAGQCRRFSRWNVSGFSNWPVAAWSH